MVCTSRAWDKTAGAVGVGRRSDYRATPSQTRVQEGERAPWTVEVFCQTRDIQPKAQSPYPAIWAPAFRIQNTRSRPVSSARDAGSGFQDFQLFGGTLKNLKPPKIQFRPLSELKDCQAQTPNPNPRSQLEMGMPKIPENPDPLLSARDGGSGHRGVQPKIFLDRLRREMGVGAQGFQAQKSKVNPDLRFGSKWVWVQLVKPSLHHFRVWKSLSPDPAHKHLCPSFV